MLRDAVSSEAPLLQRYVIRRVLEQLAGKRKDLTREHLESVRELFEKQVGKVSACRMESPPCADTRRSAWKSRECI